MALSAAEQYLLELINRARLDPAGEAARFGISLNAGLPAGQLTTQSRQVLAPNQMLEQAAIGHSQWMLAADVFSHTGSGGSTPTTRAAQQGYYATSVGENVAWRGASFGINLDAIISVQYQDFFLSAGHRANLLYEGYREVGVAQERGLFASGGYNFDASMVTTLFGTTGSKVMLTGVSYNDTNRDGFYSIGEGVAGISFTAQGLTTRTATAGGYVLSLTTGPSVAVTGLVGNLSFSMQVGMNNGNVKLDIVNGTTALSSGDITLVSGINNVTLLGNAALKATGSAAANVIKGNSGGNILDGGTGNDTINGMGGNDNLIGRNGNDTLSGDAGGDRLSGGAGNDLLSGGVGADRFVFGRAEGNDRITDFSLAAQDRLVFDDALWSLSSLTRAQVVTNFAHVVVGGVVFEFSPSDSVTLTGVTTLAGLADALQII
jgi:serralysin